MKFMAEEFDIKNIPARSRRTWGCASSWWSGVISQVSQLARLILGVGDSGVWWKSDQFDPALLYFCIFLKSYYRKCDRRVWWELMIKRLLLSSRCSVSLLWPNQPLLINFNLHLEIILNMFNVVILKGSGVECVAVAREVRKMKKRSRITLLVLSQAKTTTHYLYLSKGPH